MERRILAIFAVVLLVAACGGNDTGKPGGSVGPSSGGSGGSPPPGGTGGDGGGSGSFGTGGAGSGGTGPSGAGGTGGGAAVVDASAADSSSGGTGGAADASPPLSGEMLGWYEAEAPGNEFVKPAQVATCGAGPCASMADVKELAECCSGGKKVSNVERGNGKLTINKISAPSDGMYDVSWWYHCGKNDNFRDPGCGGDPTRTKSGCRPHVLVVNGVQLPKTFEFHCFPGSWGELHVATTPVPLKAGADNSIRVFATPGQDAADLDAIAVYPAGKGLPPVPFSH